MAAFHGSGMKWVVNVSVLGVVLFVVLSFIPL